MSPHWPHGAALWMIGTFTVAVAVGTIVNWWQNRPVGEDAARGSSRTAPPPLPPRAGINSMFDPRPGRRT